ncbi:MAG: FAD-dependent oxidoreductase, partial [Longimicrobiales bacterium]|nr:FAD-dependent oxidoreductase [Longimicrobiales bacterium]
MIAVVGGGITGLALGWELGRRGADFRVLEARSEPGGVIRSAEVEGRMLDWGPQRARLTAGVRSLVEALGLSDQVVEAPGDLDLFVYRAGRLRKVPFSARAFLASDIVSPWAKLRLALEPFTAGADPQERVADFFTRKVGREVYETVVAPLYGGLYGSDPADMRVGLSLIHVLREFGVRRSLTLPLLRRGGRVDPPPACTFKDGMQALPRALADRLGARLRLSSPVRGLRRDGEGWAVELADGVVHARAVVLTTPAPVTSALLREVAPEASAAVARLRYNPLAVVHLDADTGLRGLGFQVAFTESALALRGVTFNDSLFGRRNLYTAYLGGARHPEVVEMDDAGLAARAVEEFRICTGHGARALAVERERMPAWDVSWSALADVRLPAGLHVAANWWSRPGLPGRLTEAGRMAGLLAGSGAG